MKIEIFTQKDSDECETCGVNYDSGGYVLVDGKEVFRYDPAAYCWGCANYDTEDLLLLALKVVGIEVQHDGETPHSLYKYDPNPGDEW